MYHRMSALFLHPFKMMFSCSLSWKQKTLLEMGKEQNWQHNYSGLRDWKKGTRIGHWEEYPQSAHWLLKILLNLTRDRTLANLGWCHVLKIFSISSPKTAKQGRQYDYTYFKKTLHIWPTSSFSVRSQILRSKNWTFQVGQEHRNVCLNIQPFLFSRVPF